MRQFIVVPGPIDPELAQKFVDEYLASYARGLEEVARAALPTPVVSTSDQSQKVEK